MKFLNLTDASSLRTIHVNMSLVATIEWSQDQTYLRSVDKVIVAIVTESPARIVNLLMPPVWNGGPR